MPSCLKQLLSLMVCLVWLAGCGGGANSTVTTILCSSSPDCSLSGPTVGGPFVQKVNNLEVTVDNGPADLFSLPTNMLYATVTVCAPGARPTDVPGGQCVTIDHVQVDTGSVGLRILASKASSLGLIPVELPADASSAGLAGRAHECYPFVAGGLWGPTAVADVRLGEQWASALTVQLIQDDPNAALQVPLDCYNWIDGQVLSSATALGSNGILGIGSVVLDCGALCLDKHYLNSHVQYYSCPPGATSALNCSAAAVDANLQVYNPVARLAPDPGNNNLADNNGVVLVLPTVPDTGAAKVNGELIFGINTRSTDSLARSVSNQLPAAAARVHLGVDWQNNLSAHGLDSYLNISTQYQGGPIIYNSYLDTGTNGLFFSDSSIALCSAAVAGKPTWYCPATQLFKSAVLSDGDSPGLNAVTVDFLVRDSGSVSPSSTALPGMAGAPADPATSAASFSWGLPFFYGKRVSLSIWDKSSKDPLYSAGPWYSF